MSAHTGFLPIGIGIFILLLWGGAIAWLTVRRDERRWDLHCVNLLTGIYLAFFWRTVFGIAYQPSGGGDLANLLFPIYRFAARTLTEGRLPLWNPHLFGGAPWIGDIQAGFLYPPNLLLFFLDPSFDYRWMQLLGVGHLWWAALGAFVLVRALGHSRPAALLAGTAFGLCDVLFIHLGNLNMIAVLSWCGWILAACHMALTRKSLGWAGTAGVLFAIANYAGHAQSSFYLGCAVVLYTAGVLGVQYWEAFTAGSFIGASRQLLSYLRYPITVIVLAACCSAPIVLPALELLPFTHRADFTYEQTVRFSLPPVVASVGLLTPSFFGRGPGRFWGWPDRVETPYVGLVTFLLAVGALLLPVTAKRRRLVPWLTLALFGFVVALGGNTPVHGLLTEILPVYDSLRAPARAIVLWSLAVAVLAATGLDALLKGDDGGEDNLRLPHAALYFSFLRIGLPAIPLTLVPLLLAKTDVLQGGARAFKRAYSAGEAVLLATLVWLAGWLMMELYRGKRLPGRFLAGLLLIVLLLELTVGAHDIDIGKRFPAGGFEHPEIMAYIRERAAERLVEDAGASAVDLSLAPYLFRIDGRTGISGLFQPNIGAMTGLQSVWGMYNPLTLKHWEGLWESNPGRGTRIYDMLNVYFVITNDESPMPEEFELSFDAPGHLTVHEHPDPLPRAWLVGGAQIATDEEAALVALLEPTFEPAETVVLMEDDAHLLAEEAPPSRIGTDVSILSYSENQIVLAANAERAGYLVLSEVWYPGWRATINGAAAPILRANYTLRALPVPAGELAIRMWYAPESWRRGLTLFAVGILLLAGMCLWEVGGRSGWKRSKE